MKTKNNKPSSEFAHEDKCPSCGSPCNIHADLDDNDECNDCRNQIDTLEMGQIIPKEDPKQEPKQETLEEIALKLYPLSAIPRKIWLRGAKWHQEQNKNLYSEEEIKQLFESMISEIEFRKQNIILNSEIMTPHLLEGGCIAFESSQDVIKEKFEQFKKK